MKDGRQCTIAWYVDNCIVTHYSPSILKEVTDWLQNEFGEMEVTTGSDHDFLGMKFHIREDKKVEIDMKKQIQDIIDDFEKEGKVITSPGVTSAAAPHLFSIREDSESLNDEQSDIFHSITAKLLYVMKRARPDIETAVSFLMRRVSKSDVDDWKKLSRLIGWLKRTKDDVRVIGANSLSKLFTWIDAAYAVHDNMRGHTGGAISMGHGIIHGRAGMQKINTKSSTESELVGMAEYIPYNLWLLMFLEEQGYGIKENVIYQDNKSAILMEKNGRNLCTGNLRHINVRYFFIKDRIEKGEVKVEYLPTDLMLADFYTKPLNGAKFEYFRKFIMGWRPMSELHYELDVGGSQIKERVGNT